MQQAWDGNKGKSSLRTLKSVTVPAGLTLFAKSNFNQTQISDCRHFLYPSPCSQMPSHHLSSTDRGRVFTSFFLIRLLVSSHPIGPQKSHSEVKLENESCQVAMKLVSFLHLPSRWSVSPAFTVRPPIRAVPVHAPASLKEDPVACSHQENHVRAVKRVDLNPLIRGEKRHGIVPEAGQACVKGGLGKR